MTIRPLDRSQYQTYLEQVSRTLSRHTAEVQVAPLGIYTPYALEWTPLRSLAYSPEKDTLQLVTDDLDHLIPQPQALHIDATEDVLRGIVIVDASGHSRRIRLRRPLPLEQ